VWLVNVSSPGLKAESEVRILIIDQTRAFLFGQGGKLDVSFHFLEIKEASSIHANIVRCVSLDYFHYICFVL
jgi:hypothetical protein